MSVYKSEKVKLSASAESVYGKLSNLENLRSLLANVPADSVPEDKRDLLDSIEVTADSISVPAGPVGNLTFRVVEKRDPSYIKLDAENSPIPLSLAMDVKPETANECEAQVIIDINIPMMMAPLIGGQIQKMADQFGQVLKSIPFA